MQLYGLKLNLTLGHGWNTYSHRNLHALRAAAETRRDTQAQTRRDPQRQSKTWGQAREGAKGFWLQGHSNHEGMFAVNKTLVHVISLGDM
jgi:hypothetical protein